MDVQLGAPFSISPMFRLAQWLAFATPLALFVAMGAPSEYWFDSGEFIAAASSLAVSHPPGHPLFALTTKALMLLLPLGSIAFRASLVSGLSAAIVSLVVFHAARGVARAGGAPQRTQIALAFASALVVGTSSSLGMQAVRAEVYALQALVTIGGLALAAKSLEQLDRRHLVAAGLCMGLALSNHHFLALLGAPGLAAALALSARRTDSPRRLTATVCAAAALGLVTYAFLPLRADANGTLGAADNWRDFLWVISAEVYQRSVHLSLEPWDARVADVGLLLAGDLAGVGLAAAVGGFYAFARLAPLRSTGAVWAPAAMLFPLARAWLGFIKDNPDAAGYVVPGLGALTISAVAFGAVALRVIAERNAHAAKVFVLIMLLMAVVIGPGRADRYSKRSFWAAQDLVSASVAQLPPRGVIISSHPETSFVLLSLAVTSAERPDATHVALPFLGYPGYAGALVRRDSGVGDLVRATVLEGTLTETELSSLAAMRPTVVELDVTLPRSVDGYLVPRGPLAFARAEPTAAAELEESAGAHRALWVRLLERMAPWSREERKTRSVILWHRYLEALLYAARGQRGLAMESALAAESAIEGTPELRDLRFALRSGEGPLDVTQFLPREPARARQND